MHLPRTWSWSAGSRPTTGSGTATPTRWSPTRSGPARSEASQHRRHLQGALTAASVRGRDVLVVPEHVVGVPDPLDLAESGVLLRPVRRLDPHHALVADEVEVDLPRRPRLH